MINARDLRIGNLVAYSSVYEGYHQTVIAIMHDNYLDVGYRKALKVDAIHPIQLTEEWLLKFGFVADNTYWSKGLIMVGYTTSDESLQYEYLTGVKGSMTEMLDLKYVHQLQNLYFALTGEELQIQEEQGYKGDTQSQNE